MEVSTDMQEGENTTVDLNNLLKNFFHGIEFFSTACICYLGFCLRSTVGCTSSQLMDSNHSIEVLKMQTC